VIILITLIPKIKQHMKKSLLFLFAAITTAHVSAQVTGITVEEFYTDNGTVTGYPAGHTTYRIYAECTNPGDMVLSVSGSDIAPLALNVPDGIWNSPEPSNAAGSANNCNLYGVIPSLQYDSYVTIGRSCNTDPGSDVLIAQDPSAPWAGRFDTAPYGDGNLLLNTTIGGAWSAAPLNLQGVANPNVLAGDDLRVLIAQITTSGSVCGSFNVQARLQGQTNGATLYTGLSFGTEGCGTPGCSDPTALNYDETAGFNDGTCLYECALAFEEISSVNPTCLGDEDGSISVVVGGFQDVLEIEFDGADPAASSGTYSENGLGEGVYSIVARDRKFYNELFNPGGIYGTCEVTEFVDLITSPVTFGEASILDVTCGGADDGCALIDFSGGIGSVSFSIHASDDSVIESGMPSAEYCGLAGGNYYFSSLDENGCESVSDDFTIVSPPQLILFLGASAPATCFNSADGTQVFTWSGGTGDVDWSLEDDGTYELEGNLSNLVLSDITPGTYTMYAVDANGCTASIEYTKVGGPVINIEVEAISPSCPGDADGMFVVAASGGTGALTYDIGCTGESSEVNMAEGLSAGVYSVCVTDAEGCVATADVVIEDPTELSVSFNVLDVSCNGDADGVIEVIAEGGTGAYNYSLDGDIYSDSNLFEELEPGTYDAFVTDDNGCLIQVLGAIVVAEPEAITVTLDDFGGDGGLDDGFIFISVNGGTGEYSYNWSNGSAEEDQVNLADGDYSVVVTDENGCTTELTGVQILGISEMSNGTVVSIYPNPTNAEFRLNLDGLNGERVTYSIVDGQGRLVIAKELGNTSGSRSEVVDVRALAAGVYFLNVVSGDATTSIKLIKQ
jgi:hypothetical protein